MGTSTQRCSRIVVKVGSGLVSAVEGVFREEVIGNLVRQLVWLRAQGHEVLLVSSGAIALGSKVLGAEPRSRTIAYQQAAAAVGQSRLMQAYEQQFGSSGQTVAQVLLTHDDLHDRVRYLNARNTLLTLLGFGAIPIINENDTVSVDEIRFGDNDTLAAMVCSLTDADLLILLTDLDGLYTADPRRDPQARFIPVVEKVDARIEALAGATTHPTGRGGMYSKIQAAKVAGTFGLHTYIANGLLPDTLRRIVAGEEVGTHLYPTTVAKLSSRKRWIGFAVRAKGSVVVDQGAQRALTSRGKSLLPSGIVEVSGQFRFGDPVYCVDPSARRFAKGLVNYSTAELQAIMGQHTSKIESILGHKEYDEVIHRDNLVLL